MPANIVTSVLGKEGTAYIENGRRVNVGIGLLQSKPRSWLFLGFRAGVPRSGEYASVRPIVRIGSLEIPLGSKKTITNFAESEQVQGPFGLRADVTLFTTNQPLAQVL